MPKRTPQPPRTCPRVAFLSFDWDYEIVAEYYRGMEAYLSDRTDLQAVIFSAFGHYHVHFEADAGAHKLFSLCNPDLYDGFIVQGNRTWGPELRQEFVDRVVALGKPVVSINYSLEGAHVVGTDNYQAAYGLIDRVLRDYDCRDVAFVNGLATSAEAQARAQAYRDACVAHGIENPRFYQADWQIESGRALAEQIVESGRPLPEVIFCCNDDLAIGIQEVLQRYGVRVPDQVMLTGFDNREISRCTTPRIATVDRDYFTVGQTALDTMRRLLAGEEVPPVVTSPVRYCLRESCGYDLDPVTGSVSDLYSLDNSLKRFYEVLNSFQSSLYGAGSLNDILRTCEHFAPDVHCPAVYLTMSDKYLHFDVGQDLQTYADISHLMACWGSEGVPPCDSRHIYASYTSDEILPASARMDAPLYTVYPLRHGEMCIGTLVTQGVSPMMSHGFLTFCITLLAAGISNIRNVELLRTANARLDNLYVHDELTGLFNRFGLQRFGTIAYEHLLRDFEEAHFIFVDIDDMKHINDKYGHEAGDAAICDTADVIRRATIRENAFSMRYGGDEFMLICRRNIIPRLREELELLNDSSRQPYELELSMGAYRVGVEELCSMDEAIRRADEQMYEIKKAHKAAHCS